MSASPSPELQKAVDDLSEARDILLQASLELRDALFETHADPQVLQAQVQLLDELLEKARTYSAPASGKK
jgi:DNA repair ATPase RecN